MEVDRGVATYVQPLPAEEEAAVPGWGRKAAGRSYVEVAALPSATRQGQPGRPGARPADAGPSSSQGNRS